MQKHNTLSAKFTSTLAGMENNPCFLERPRADTNMSQGSPHDTQRQAQTPINIRQRSLTRWQPFKLYPNRSEKPVHITTLFLEKKYCTHCNCLAGQLIVPGVKLSSMSKFRIIRWILTCVPFSQPECFAVFTENCSHNIYSIDHFKTNL